MSGRRTKICIVVLTVFAVLVAEFGQVGCHASCFAASIGKVAQCPLSCCSQKQVAKSSCCSVSGHTPKGCNENCPQCPVCRAPTRAITSSKALLVIPVNVAWALPTALAPQVRLFEVARVDFRAYKVIAALHPPLQVLNCVWRN